MYKNRKNNKSATMAEVVEAHKERALAQYEQMQMLDLFTPEEIGYIKKRKNIFAFISC